MGHIIAWDNNAKTVVLQQYHAPANKDDLYQLAKKSSEMLRSVSHPVHLIIDERAVKLMLTTADLQYLENLVPPNQGMIVMVMPRREVSYKMLAQNLGRLVAPKAINQSNFAATLEEARAILQNKVAVLYP